MPNPPRQYTADEQIEMAAQFMAATGMRPDEISDNDPMPSPGVLSAQIQATENQLKILAGNFSKQAGIFQRIRAVIFGVDTPQMHAINIRSTDNGSGQYNGPEMDQ